MTILCAIEQQSGPTLLGSNSRSLVGDTVLASDHSKWLRMGEWAVSFTGRGLLNDMVQTAAADFPVTDSAVAVMAYLRSVFREAEIGKEDDGAMDFDTSGLLVRREGRIYDIDCRLSVEPINRGELWATGSGMEYALGASFALPEDTPGKARIRRALEAAITLDSGCPGVPLIEEF